MFMIAMESLKYTLLRMTPYGVNTSHWSGKGYTDHDAVQRHWSGKKAEVEPFFFCFSVDLIF